MSDQRIPVTTVTSRAEVAVYSPANIEPLRLSNKPGEESDVEHI
jgi:hypothetical protein